jgi:hypothetical protein
MRSEAAGVDASAISESLVYRKMWVGEWFPGSGADLTGRC